MARWEQIAEALRHDIRSGVYHAGARLPTETELADRFNVSVPTIRQALGELLQQELIEKQHGVGSFVRQTPPVRRVAMERYRSSAETRQGAPQTSFTHDQAITWSAYQLDKEFERVRADEPLARLLEVNSGAELLRRYFVFHANDVPQQISTNYLPWSLVGGTLIADPDNEPWPGGTFDQARTLGHPVTRVEESVSARMPTPEEVDVLRMSRGTPVLAITRRLVATDLVVEVCRDIVLPSDQVVLDYAIDL